MFLVFKSFRLTIIAAVFIFGIIKIIISLDSRIIKKIKQQVLNPNLNLDDSLVAIQLYFCLDNSLIGEL